MIPFSTIKMETIAISDDELGAYKERFRIENPGSVPAGLIPSRMIDERGHTVNVLAPTPITRTAAGKGKASSKISIECFEALAQNVVRATIWHSENGGEVIIPTNRHNYHVDGYCPSTLTVYEFQGEHYHVDWGSDSGPAANTRALSDHNKLCQLRRLGYRVFEIRESEWKARKRALSKKTPSSMEGRTIAEYPSSSSQSATYDSSITDCAASAESLISRMLSLCIGPPSTPPSLDPPSPSTLAPPTLAPPSPAIVTGAFTGTLIERQRRSLIETIGRIIAGTPINSGPVDTFLESARSPPLEEIMDRTTIGVIYSTIPRTPAILELMSSEGFLYRFVSLQATTRTINIRSDVLSLQVSCESKVPFNIQSTVKARRTQRDFGTTVLVLLDLLGCLGEVHCGWRMRIQRAALIRNLDRAATFIIAHSDVIRDLYRLPASRFDAPDGWTEKKVLGLIKTMLDKALGMKLVTTDGVKHIDSDYFSYSSTTHRYTINLPSMRKRVVRPSKDE